MDENEPIVRFFLLRGFLFVEKEASHIFSSIVSPPALAHGSRSKQKSRDVLSLCFHAPTSSAGESWVGAREKPRTLPYSQSGLLLDKNCRPHKQNRAPQ